MKTAIELIDDERSRQMEVEGWTPKHDDEHGCEELARAASAYAMPESSRIYAEHRDGGEMPDAWPFHPTWFRPTPDDRIRELVKAGALIVAEIERLQRKESDAG